MSWQDRGVIFHVNHLLPWAASHCYVPTALAFPEFIRIYVAFWDNKKHSRLAFIDVDASQPTQVIGYSQTPLLEDSSPGSFDQNGVVPLSVIQEESQIRLYYAGWQKREVPNDIGYQIYTGLAISKDNGNTFTRFSTSPVMNKRSDSELIRTGGYTTKISSQWRTWLASYSGTVLVQGKYFPTYHLETMISNDGIHWPSHQTIALPFIPENILGYGRSSIWQEHPDMYHGLFSVRAWNGKYKGIYYATSSDGISWSKITLAGMGFSPAQTCDQQNEVAFQSLIHQKDRILMFYNGNGFGEAGLRLAIWSKGG